MYFCLRSSPDDLPHISLISPSYLPLKSPGFPQATALMVFYAFPIGADSDQTRNREDKTMNSIAKTEIFVPDYSAIKHRQQATWGAGDYSRIGITLQITGEQLCEALDLRAGRTVLDVAAGNGNATLAAARRFCQVTSTDYVPELLKQSLLRANAENLPVNYMEADAEKLPFDTGSFDFVISTFGVMFTPDQTSAASELKRVCKTGGRIGLACWTPDSFIGELFRTIGKYVPPPAGVNSPAVWGTEEFIQRNFGDNAVDITNTRRNFVFRYYSPEHWLDIFTSYYGPVLKAFEKLEQQQQSELWYEIMALMSRFNRADDGTLVLPAPYLETVITLS